MVVTCENCSARYKLDDNRISGRGAKITCPRCRHVFVVYKERPAAQEAGKVAVGGGVATPSSPPAPAPTPSAPAAAAAGSSAEVEVDSLDFRAVGIQAWKVKVKIGLVYDFSDYRTLARYIAEGRVTASDKLSHDGSEWIEIASIPDLAAHFVSVYRQLEAEQAAADDEEEEDFEDDEPTNIMGMGGDSFDASAQKAVSLTSFSSSAAPRILPSGGSGPAGADIQSAMSAALDSEAGGGAPKAPVGPRFIDPFEKRKNTGRTPKPRASGSTSGGRPRPRPRPKSKGGASNEKGGNSGMMIILLLVIIGGGGIWWFLNRQADTTPQNVDTTPALQAGPGEKSREQIRDGIIEDIKSGTEVEPEDDTPPEDDEAWGGGEDDTPELIPIGPRGPSRPTKKSSSSIPSQSAGPTARDHASDGDRAMKRGDYRSATSSYQKAVGMEPSNSVYNGRLGAAMVRGGQADAAMDPLMKAASGGYSPAFVYLGDIAASRGDNAGAIGYYQSYLATNPRDAGAVQAKIDRLSGS